MFLFFIKQKTAYEMRISDWSSDVCSSDLLDVSQHDSLADAISSLEGVDVADGIYRLFDSQGRRIHLRGEGVRRGRFMVEIGTVHIDTIESTPIGAGELRDALVAHLQAAGGAPMDAADLATLRSEEHTSELQSLMRTWYAV